MAVYTFIQENSTVTVKDVKAYCRIDNDAYDTALKFILAGVKQQADSYCNNNFTLYGGEVPAQVELWILRACATIYERPNFISTRQDVWEQGSDYWEFEWDKYIEDLKPYREEPGFA